MNSRSTNSVEKIKSITNNRGANVIFDTSGMMFAESVEIAAMDARIPIIAAPADGKSTFNLRGLYRKKLRILGVDTRPTDGPTCAKMLEQMAPDFNSGRFKANPNKSYPLTEAIAAYEEAAHGGARIILKPNP
jgi:NADPH:quinone reductase-like Zn-dependent oxidoreductase